jgi:hypothetical protein
MFFFLPGLTHLIRPSEYVPRKLRAEFSADVTSAGKRANCRGIKSPSPLRVHFARDAIARDTVRARSIRRFPAGWRTGEADED